MTNHEAPGYIYVKQSGIYFKIGMSIRPYERTLGNTSAPDLTDPVRLVAVFPVENMRRAERSLHQRFQAKRVLGEWFLLSDDDMRVIERVAYGDIVLTDPKTIEGGAIHITRHVAKELRRIALSLGFVQFNGVLVGGGNTAAMLEAIARGELQVTKPNPIDSSIDSSPDATPVKQKRDTA